MDKRTLFYWGKMYLENIKKGEDFKSLEKVITINILDFEFLGTESYQSSFHLWEDLEKDYMLTDVVEIHFLELPKFRRKNDKNFKDSSIERWLTFLEKDISDNTLKELIELEPVIQKAENKIEYLSADKNAMELYWNRERSLHERANMINSAMDKGREEGREEGREAGKIESAISFLDILDDETIATKLGLEINLVKDLRFKNNK